MTPTPEPRDAGGRVLSDHVLGHLTPRQRDVAAALAGPVTIGLAAERMGYANRTSLEHHWLGIRNRLWLESPDDTDGSGGSLRVALVRILYGIDPCPCGRG